MTCVLCGEESDNEVCDYCEENESYQRCIECGQIDTSDNIYKGYCESCYVYNSKPEWMGNEDDFHDSYDPDRD